ncbi:MAG: hypothetical protein HOI53_04295 [Francisellaceae bacterium]|nr:hypothetical protein [Francisellaceae bacterium]
MTDIEFLLHPAIAGIAIAIIAGPLGIFMIWRRMSFVGDTIAHSSLMGVSLALWLQTSPIIGVGLVGFVIAVLVAQDDQGKILGSDAILGIISQASLAIGIIASTSLVPFRVDLLGYLYGDILSVTENETIWILVINSLMLVITMAHWRKFIAISLNRQLASISGINVKLANITYLLLVVATIGIGMRLVGVLLITAMLIIPSATSRFFSKTPEQMAIMASVFGVISVVLGLIMSLYFDWPSGPTIVIISVKLWLFGYVVNHYRQAKET